MQYGNVDITLDVIRGIDTIRRGAHAVSWGICESGCIHVLMPKIEMDILRLSHICDIYMPIQCTPLSVEKAGVAPDMILRFTAHKQVSVQVKEPPLL